MVLRLLLVALATSEKTGIIPLNNFVHPDPDYTGPLNVSGRVVLSHSGDTVTLSFHLSGVDPSCQAPHLPSYSCGIVLMSGFSCNDIGSTYFATPEDPWQNSLYVFDQQTNTSTGNFSITYGHSIEETLGRVLVIYDNNAQAIACSQLPSLTDELNLGQLSPYPGYTGSLAPSGQVELDFRATSVQIAFILSGMDPLCVAKNSSIPNSCGIHIHEGTSCQNASSHYFNPAIFPKDPWANVSYVSSAAGNAVGLVNVEYGYGFEQTRGRAFVVHDYTGARVSCVLIADRSERTLATLAPLTPYPGYAGTLNITGAVKAEFGGGGVKLSYNLEGLEPACREASTTAPNSCGIHIHAGFSCDDAQGHYFNPSAFTVDPWAQAAYAVDNNTQSPVIVSFGYGFAASQGRVVVVHEYDGSRVACAVLPSLTDRVLLPQLSPYPATEPTKGSFQLDFRSSSVQLSYNFAAADARCVAPSSAAMNSCGLKIYSGSSCAKFVDAGVPFFNNRTITKDPWNNTVYKVAPNGSGVGVLNVENGYGYADTVNHVLVTHNYDGIPVACAQIFAATAPAAQVSGVTLSGNISGTIQLAWKGMGLLMTYNLDGLDPVCTEAAVAREVCSLQISREFDCKAVKQYSSPADPWTFSSYTVESIINRTQGSMIISYGEDFSGSQGRALVLRDHSGAIIGCTNIAAATQRLNLPPFDRLPFSDSPTTYAGTTSFDFRPTSVRIIYNLSDTDVRCTNTAQGNINSCGIRIRTGVNCSDLGISLYDTSKYTSDPWAFSHYVAASDGTAQGMFDVEFGFGFEQSKGHAVVIHDFAGEPMACAVLPLTLDAKTSANVKLDPLKPFPGYNGSLAPQLLSSAVDFEGSGVAFTFHLSGLPCECSRPGLSPNSCGFHIHNGTSCDTAGGVGPHWFSPSLSADPWASANYITTTCGANSNATETSSTGSLTISYGYTFQDTKQKVLVVHDYDGTKIGCALIHVPFIAPADQDATGALALQSFTPFDGYSGPYKNATGKMLLRFVDSTVALQYHLSGVDPDCVNRLPDVTDSCGMIIYSGFSCASNETLGQPFYNHALLPSDPWAVDGFYVSTASGEAIGHATVDFRWGVDSTKGRVLVLHDRLGTRISCTVLGATTDRVTAGRLGVYPDYKGQLRAAGCVDLTFRATSVQIKYALTGLEKNCTTRSSKPNSCGIHIHTGPCQNSSTVGGHFYDQEAFPVDPWANASYVTDVHGTAKGTVDVEFGYGFSASEGRSVVLHDVDGNRVSCAEIPVRQGREIASVDALVTYPGYNGSQSITGNVQLDFRGDGVKLSFNLQGIQPDCATPSLLPNSCGIHIHSGLNCNDAQGHFFDSTVSATDPWVVASYTASSGSIIVSNGYGYEETKGKVVVVHDYYGNRTACGEIPATTHRVGMGFKGTSSGGMVLDFRATNVKMQYFFVNLDTKCMQTPSERNNSCNIQISESCANPDKHVFSNRTGDPWGSAHYTTLAGTLDVEFGYGYAESVGKALVVRAMDGTVLVCGTIPPMLPNRDTGVATFTSGSLQQAKVLLSFIGNALKLNYDMKQVESECVVPGSSPKSCSFQISQGFSCENPGEPLYIVHTNPWVNAHYSAIGNRALGSVIVDMGLDLDGAMGRALLVHNYHGEVIGCALLSAVTEKVMITQVNDTISLDFRLTSVKITYDLEMPDLGCTDSAHRNTSFCNFEIHAGNCSDPGPDLYDPTQFPDDPWVNAFYVIDKFGSAQGEINVENGKGYHESVGRAFLLRDSKGAQVSCWNIPSAMASTASSSVEMLTYPAYSGPYAPALVSANVLSQGDGAIISYSLTSVPCECWQVGNVSNSCGLHIRAGNSCLADGPNLYDEKLFPVDPWAFTVYRANKCGGDCSSSTATGSVTLSFGKGGSDLLNSVLVVYDYSGNRIGCGRIQPIFEKGPTQLIMPFLIIMGALALVLILGLLYRSRRNREANVNAALYSALGETTVPKKRAMSLNQ